MPEITPGKEINTAEPVISLTVPDLSPGSHRFQLIVVDSSGNQSAPAFLIVEVKDDQAPIARLTGPSAISIGQAINLSGDTSEDRGGGRIVQYRWMYLGPVNITQPGGGGIITGGGPVDR